MGYGAGYGGGPYHGGGGGGGGPGTCNAHPYIYIYIYTLHLEDHHMTCRCHVTMVIVSPLTGVIPFPNGLFMASKWGVTIYLLTGKILQAVYVSIFFIERNFGENPWIRKKLLPGRGDFSNTRRVVIS